MNEVANKDSKITAENAIEYTDSICDGGYWYTIENSIPVLKFMTPKLLKLLGYESVEEMNSLGVDIYTFTNLIFEVESTKETYEALTSGKIGRAFAEIVLIAKNGMEYFCQLTVCRSTLFSGEDGQVMFKATVILFDQRQSVFRQSRELLQTISSGIAIFKLKDEVFQLVYANDSANSILKYENSELDKLYGNDILHFIDKRDHQRIKEIEAICLNEGKTIRDIIRVYTKEGETIYLNCEYKCVKIGQSRYLYNLFMDVNNIVERQAVVENTNAMLEAMINVAPAGITIYQRIDDSYKLIAANDTLIDRLNEWGVDITGTGLELTKKDLTVNSYDILLKMVSDEDKPMIMECLKEVRRTGSGECTYRIVSNKNKANRNIYINCKMTTKQWVDGSKVIVTAYEDVSKFIEIEEELRLNQMKLINLSYRDTLTNVLNRLSYNEFLKRVEGKTLVDTGVAFVDLNGLKMINDLYGHERGDDSIQLTSMLIRHYFDSDDIYRLSGDTFVIIKEGIDSEEFYSRMVKLTREFEQYDLAAVGYNWSSEVSNVEKSVNHAESAMRVAKQEYYAGHSEDTSKHRPVHLNDLLRDLKYGRYQVYFQPKAYCKDKRIVAAEALVRRYDDNGNIIPPDRFIKTLEKEKLIPNVDMFVLEQTCSTLERWNRENSNMHKFKISVNMSRVTIVIPDYISKITTIVDRYDIDRSQLEFEITESQATMDKTFLNALVDDLVNEGFGVSLDDMGSDYSSINMLIMEGIDTIKLDRGLILQIDSDNGNKLIQYLISMCHGFNKLIIAEGVEDDATRLKLEDMGCDMYQGYLLSPPISIPDFEKLLKEN